MMQSVEPFIPSSQTKSATAQENFVVKKRNGSTEPVDASKIMKAIERCSNGLTEVDPLKVATKTIRGLYNGATTKELDQLSIQTAASLVSDEPQYAKLAARLLATFVEKEVEGLEIHAFSQSITTGHSLGLINDRLCAFVMSNARKLNAAVRKERDQEFEYFGIRTVYDRYLLKHPEKRLVIETPQYFFLRVACALSETVAEALELYNLFSKLEYLPSSPTLFNAGTSREQLSSCFLLDSPDDDLDAIYRKYGDVAKLSKFAGGIGLAYHRIRSRGSLIKGTNGHSNGLIPWLKTLDSSVACVNQCFAPDTWITTSAGPKHISSVVAGDLVLGRSGQFREVLDHYVYDQGDDPMVSLKVKHSVFPMKVTAGHPFLAIRGVRMEQAVSVTLSEIGRGKYSAEWVEAKDLAKGDYLAQVIPSEVVPVEGFTEDDARMYGLMLGDGHSSTTTGEWGISLNPSKDRHVEFIREYLANRGIHSWEHSRGESTYLQIRWAQGFGLVNDGTTGRFVAGSSSPTLPFSREDLYDSSGNKRLSRKFSHLPKNQTLALLQGLLESDGGVSRGKEIYFTSTSLLLAESVRYQLLRLGVPCAGQYRERLQKHKGVRSSGKVIHFDGVTKSVDLRIPAIKEIADRIGCTPLTKKNWFEYQGAVWSRLISNEISSPVPTVHDLKVDIDETYMTSAALAHNGGKRKGACCVYIETWHADIEEFLELRDNTGDSQSRTHNLNIANWVPDIFMKRVGDDGDWSLFDPKAVPQLPDLYGDDFERAYTDAEHRGLAVRKVKARDLYARMMRTLAETGNGWITFKDKSNKACNQTALPGRTVHLSNLCTEILEVTSNDETAVCNLGSINLARHMADGQFDFKKLAATVTRVVRQLDRVIDLNFYPIDTAKSSNMKWRPVGLGIMGLQDVFFQLGLPFDSEKARILSKSISEEIYFRALTASIELAKIHGPHPSFHETRAAKGELQFDAWGVTPSNPESWEALREEVKKHGLRNSLLIAIAPTATIASIAGCYECIEPQVSNLFKRETLSGDFLQINRYLIEDLKRLGMWTDEMRDQLKVSEGSVQGLEGLPEYLHQVYRTAWEIPMKSLIDMAADRGAFIDQSQSLNLFLENPKIGPLSSMYNYAWKKGLKTTYYLRSRPATKIAKATVPTQTKEQDIAAVVCSLENPEACESCQ